MLPVKPDSHLVLGWLYPASKPVHRRTEKKNATWLGLIIACLLTLVDSTTLAKPPRVHGRVTFRGEVPKSKTADGEGIRQLVLKVNEKNHGLAEAVVFLQSLEATANEDQPAPRIPPAEEAAPEKAKQPAVVIDQKGYSFQPRLVAVHQGEVVRFTNHDSANHNVHAFAADPANQFNVFTSADGKYDHRFVANAKGRPVVIGCDIHAWMRAWVFVFNHPQFATTNLDGMYSIEDVPPGRYLLCARQPDCGLKLEREIELTENAELKETVEFTDKDCKQ